MVWIFIVTAQSSNLLKNVLFASRSSTATTRSEQVDCWKPQPQGLGVVKVATISHVTKEAMSLLSLIIVPSRAVLLLFALTMNRL